VIVYDWNGTAWTQVGNVLTGVADQDQFSHKVAISGDGNIIAVTAPFEHGNGIVDSGTVRVYYLVGATWTILPDSGSFTISVGSPTDVFVGATTLDYLGYGGVKLSYDGYTISMGSKGHDITGKSNVGRVRVFTYSSGAWSQKGTEIVGTVANELVSNGLDMSEDGNHLVVGTQHDATSPFVNVYQWSGTAWVQKGSAITHGSGDGFAEPVSISNDGTVLAIGLPYADVADGALVDNGGLAKVYHYESSAWVLKATLMDIDTTADQFGHMVCLSGDGKRLIVGAPLEGTNQGQLFTFEYTGGSWVRRQPCGSIGAIGNPGDDGNLGDGPNSNAQGVALSRDGSTIVGGEWGYNASAGTDSGRVRVFSMPSNIKSIWGSNDDTNWTKITTAPTREEATSNVAGLAFGYDDRLEFKNLDNPNYYKYHAIVADAFTRLKEVKLYGIRNQGSSTLHDGALTLTKKVTAPQLESTGILNMKGDYTEIRANSNVVTCFDRSKKLIKYPRVALTSASQDGYNVTASHHGSIYYPWEAFDAYGDAVGWHSNPASASTTAYNGTNGLYSGTTRLATETELGEWLALELPEAIKLMDVQMISQDYSPAVHTIDNFIVYAKKSSGDTWANLGVFTGKAGAQNSAAGVTVTVDANDYYKFFAIVPTKRYTPILAGGVSIRELAFYGTPEYDPEAHGVDVTVKSVPNVPNTDWLEVYYDGQDYTSMPTTVTDKSGNNRTGTPSGGVGFDTGYKAFTFDGSNDYISSTSTATLSNHTASMWIKFDSPASWEAVYSIKPAGTLDRNNFILYVSSISFRLESSGNTGPYYDLAYNFPIGEWVHLTLVFRGTGLADCEMYIDNVRLVPTGTGRSSTDDITITGNNTIYVGNDPAGYYLDGSIANFRLFNRVLTTDEIYQLYAYQKEYFGHGALGMTLKAGRLGIGTSEPKAALDVRGDIIGGCPVFFHATRTTHAESTASVGFDPLIWQTIRNNKGGGYSTTTGKFTAPITGYYEFTYGGMSKDANDTFEMVPKLNNVDYQGPTLYTSIDGGGNTSHRSSTASAIVYMEVGHTWHLKIPSGTVSMYGTGNAYNMFTGKFLSY
jgi:hypothetical protein